MAVDFVRIIRDDNTRFHEGPSGVLEVIRGWGSAANMPETTSQPPGWTHYVPWAHIMRDATGERSALTGADAARPWTDPRARQGNRAPNSRIHARHFQMLWLLGNGQWVTGYYSDIFNNVLFPFDWGEANQSTMPAPNYRQFETGGGTSIRAVSLSNDPRNPSNPNQYRDWQWHPYGNRLPVPGGWVGFVSCLYLRRIIDNPGLPDDRAQMNILGACSFDWYISASPGGGLAQGVNVLYGGFSRFKYLTNDWQLFASSNLSEAQLRANPPPLTGLELLEGGSTSPPIVVPPVTPPPVTPPPVVVPPVPTFSRGRWMTRLVGGKGQWFSKDPQIPLAPSWEQPTPSATVTIGSPLTISPVLANPGVPAATFSKVSGPAWTFVNSTTGQVTGTATGPAGSVTVVVRAFNASGNADLSIPITVSAVPITPPVNPPVEPPNDGGTPNNPGVTPPAADSWVRLPRGAEVWVRIPRDGGE